LSSPNGGYVTVKGGKKTIKKFSWRKKIFIPGNKMFRFFIIAHMARISIISKLRAY
jgi:hypothetical protein